MKSFKQLIKEAVTEGAVFEEVIVAAWNGTPEPKTNSIAPGAGKNIVKYLKAQNITGESASKLATKGVEVTSDWSKFWLPESVPPTTKTPKTDILIGKNRISLKMGPAQLMSGGPNESKATFYAALKSMEKSGQDVDSELFKDIWSKISTLTKGAISKGKVEGELKKETTFKAGVDMSAPAKVEPPKGGKGKPGAKPAAGAAAAPAAADKAAEKPADKPADKPAETPAAAPAAAPTSEQKKD